MCSLPPGTGFRTPGTGTAFGVRGGSGARLALAAGTGCRGASEKSAFFATMPPTANKDAPRIMKSIGFFLPSGSWELLKRFGWSATMTSLS
jgi:hypothetical protein